MIHPLGDSVFDAQSDMTTAMARNAVWLNELERAHAGDVNTIDVRALGAYGARTGLLVLEEGGRQVYASSVRFHLGAGGLFLDDRGRAVLGYAVSAGDRATPRPIRIPSTVNGLALARVEIDERGVIVGVPVRTSATPVSDPIPLARLCVAVFPAPQELSEDGDVLAATRGAGTPSFSPADAANIGGLDRQPTSPQMAQLQAQARKTWIASAQAELQVALSSSRDSLVRVALDVVK